MTEPRRERRNRDQLLIVCATLGLASAVVTGVFVGPTVLDTSGRTTDVERLARENEKRIKDIAALTRENARLTQKINDERAHNVLVGCHETNRRHDATIRQLNRLVRSAPTVERERSERNLAGTVALLEAIVPHRNCAALTRRQVPSNTP